MPSTAKLGRSMTTLGAGSAIVTAGKDSQVRGEFLQDAANHSDQTKNQRGKQPVGQTIRYSS